MGGDTRRVLVVGNHCHDVLLKNDVVLAESLGGAVSFISNILPNILPNLSIPCHVISKVGPDFHHPLHLHHHPPLVVPTSSTTVFHAHFSTSAAAVDRTLKRVAACDPIRPDDISNSAAGGNFRYGMAVAVAGEILPETLRKMVRVCEVVFVDIQGLIREFDQNDGTVTLTELCKTCFADVVPEIGVLKASAEEAEFIDVEEVRKVCCVVVTYGEGGCRVFWKDGEVKIAPFSTIQVDPTGAGDSLLGGFVAGVVSGLAVADAALLGNFFGSLTVGQVGLPKFDPLLLKRVKDEVQKRSLQSAKYRVGDEGELWFSKPPGHDEFYAALNSARQAYAAVTPREVEHGQPNLRDQVTRPINVCVNGLYNGKVLHDHVYDEPILEGKP